MSPKPAASRRTDVAEAARAYRAARFADAARMLDADLERLAGDAFGRAAVLRARLFLRSDPAAVPGFVASSAAAVDGEHDRARLEMLAGNAYARLGDPKAAAARFAAAERAVADDRALRAELASARAQAAWIARDLDAADREVATALESGTGDVAIEATIVRGATAAARGDVVTQGALLLDALRLVRRDAEPDVYLWALAASQIAYLARNLAGSSLRDAAFAELGAIPWTADLAEMRFTMTRAVGWRHALEGDYFNAFRRLKDALALAPTDAWRVTAAADRAYLATVLREERWAEQELSDADDLAARVEWRSLVGEERFALLALAELHAPRDGSRALSYIARYKDAGSNFSAKLAARDDRRVAAQEAYAFGVVQVALGDSAEATRLLTEAFETFVAFGYDWRAGRAAVALAAVTGDAAWSDRARARLRAYPRSWLAVPAGAAADAVAEPPELARLTPAQRAVYDLLLRGLSTGQIGHEQGRSEFTVRNHVKAIYRVFGIRSRAALLARASGLAREERKPAGA